MKYGDLKMLQILGIRHKGDYLENAKTLESSFILDALSQHNCHNYTCSKCFSMVDDNE